MNNQEDLIAKIRVLEESLRDLRIELEESRSVARQVAQEQIKVGNRVRIRNPKKGQPKTGVVHKINRETERVTIKVAKGNSIAGIAETALIVRHLKNVLLIRTA